MSIPAPSSEAVGKSDRPARGPFTRWPRAADAALALGVFVLEVAGVVVRAAEEAGGFDMSMFGDVEAAVYLLLAASSISLLWRRTRPLMVVAATLTASVVWDIAGLSGGPSLAIFVSLYGVGRYIEDNRTSLLAVALALILVVIDDLIEAEPLSVFGLSMAVVLGGWYLGRRIKARKEYLGLLEERAEHLEQQREAAAQHAVDAERARIARELHDLVAHRVSMITVQAGAAQTVVTTDPGKAIRAMAAVEQAGREALDELRQVLGVLRSEEPPSALDPIHGLDDIPGLVDEMNKAGLDVLMSSAGVPEDLPTKVDLASYRIVQEALTNVLKHAGPQPKAEVRLSSTDQMLTIEVVDRGLGESILPGSGHGLVGMRERATLLGGTFEAGPRLGGGYRVAARLPFGGTSS